MKTIYLGPGDGLTIGANETGIVKKLSSAAPTADINSDFTTETFHVEVEVGDTTFTVGTVPSGSVIVTHVVYNTQGEVIEGTSYSSSNGAVTHTVTEGDVGRDKGRLRVDVIYMPATADVIDAGTLSDGTTSVPEIGSDGTQAAYTTGVATMIPSGGCIRLGTTASRWAIIEIV